MNRLEKELEDINQQLSMINARKDKVITDTIQTITIQFDNESNNLRKRKQEILAVLRGENELLDKIFDEME